MVTFEPVAAVKLNQSTSPGWSKLAVRGPPLTVSANACAMELFGSSQGLQGVGKPGGVGVEVAVGVKVGVAVAVGVRVGVGVTVAVGVAVGVLVTVGVRVGVLKTGP